MKAMSIVSMFSLNFLYYSPGLLNRQSMGRGSMSQQIVRSKEKEYN